jgi:glutamate racemase
MEQSVENFLHPVCVFDSGIGGLNLLKECAVKMPYQDFVYFADNYNMPYGDLPPEKLNELVFGHFDKINSLHPTAALVACNTVTSRCISFLREKYTFPIVGIQPAIKQAVACGGKCVVMATPSTVESKSFTQLLSRFSYADVVVSPCDGLADYIEKNIFSLSAVKLISFLPNVKADNVVLGCTHYIFAKEIIQNYYGCRVFDGVVGTVDHLMKILGIADHHVTQGGKIGFIGGNVDKNCQVYNNLLKP